MSRKPPGKPPTERKLPMNSPERLRRATQILVAAGRQQGHDDERIRADVKAAIAEALESDKEWVKVMPVQGEMEPLVSSAGIYRLIFENDRLDRANPYAQERWHQIVIQELEAALARDDGAFHAPELTSGEREMSANEALKALFIVTSHDRYPDIFPLNREQYQRLRRLAETNPPSLRRGFADGWDGAPYSGTDPDYWLGYEAGSCHEDIRKARRDRDERN